MELDIHHRRLAATAGGKGHILPQPLELKPSGPSPALITRTLLPKFIVPWSNIRRLCLSSNDLADFFNLPALSPRCPRVREYSNRLLQVNSHERLGPQSFDPFLLQPRPLLQQQVFLYFVAHLLERAGARHLLLLHVEQVELLRRDQGIALGGL